MPIAVGIGGWDYAPWRGRFYPAGLRKADELAYVSRRLTSIEINATFYRTQSPQSFAKWHDTVPEGFVFALKAPRAASYGKDPQKVAASIDRFLNSGLTALGAKLGPILWQLPAGRRFNEAEITTFLRLLPTRHQGLDLRHVIEAKHGSFADPAFTRLLAAHHAADCIVESVGLPARRAATTDFLYLRLQKTLSDAPEGYDSAELDAWASWLRRQVTSMSRGVHVYFISGAKERAPDAAQALLTRFGHDPDAVPDRDLRQA